MIYLFTDFGVLGPYVGQMKSALYMVSPKSQYIDLMHDAPPFNPMASAYLLSALTPYMHPESIVVAVVDPGVGNPTRRPVMIEADKRWFVGPDNGLFFHIIKNAASVKCYEIITDDNISASFHGRDVFAPAAGKLANNILPPAKLIEEKLLLKPDWPNDLSEVIYIDHYGNMMTGLRAKNLKNNNLLKIAGVEVPHAVVFSRVTKDSLFWYENSIGLVEISINCGNAARRLGVSVGASFSVD